MDIIESDLLQRIILDHKFAEYITQRIDIGDFDEDIANRIYDGIVDLIHLEKCLSFDLLSEYFKEEKSIIEALDRIVKDE